MEVVFDWFPVSRPVTCPSVIGYRGANTPATIFSVRVSIFPSFSLSLDQPIRQKTQTSRILKSNYKPL